MVSRKVGKAVVRNRVRRRLREGLRQLLRERAVSGLIGTPSFDLLVLVRPSAAEADYQALQTALARALEKALSASGRSAPGRGGSLRARGSGVELRGSLA